MTQTKLPLPDDDVDGLQRINLSKLLELYPETHPYKTEVWDSFIISEENVYAYVREKKFVSKPLSYAQHFAKIAIVKKRHEMRVAYLVAHSWGDAIEVDVGVPSLGLAVSVPVIDGNHRVAAAILRGDTHILASCAGDVDIIEQLL